MSKGNKANYISQGFSFTNAFVVPFAIGLSFAYLITTMITSSELENYTFTYTAPTSVDTPATLQANLNVDIQGILDDNIFNVEIGVPVDAPLESAPVAKSNYSLVGLIYNPAGSFAFVKGDGEVFLVTSNPKDDVNPCVIKEATLSSITLDCGDGGETLQLVDSREGAGSSSNSRVLNTYSAGTVSKVTGGSRVPSSGAKISPTAGGINVEISRDYVDQQLSDVNKIFTTTRIAPKYNNDEFLGYSILGFSTDSPLKAIGIQKGDIIVRINGASTNNPTALYGLVGDADSIDSLTVEVIRGGMRQTIYVSVVG